MAPRNLLAFVLTCCLFASTGCTTRPMAPRPEDEQPSTENSPGTKLGALDGVAREAPGDRTSARQDREKPADDAP